MVPFRAATGTSRRADRPGPPDAGRNRDGVTTRQAIGAPATLCSPGSPLPMSCNWPAATDPAAPDHHAPDVPPSPARAGARAPRTPPRRAAATWVCGHPGGAVEHHLVGGDRHPWSDRIQPRTTGPEPTGRRTTVSARGQARRDTWVSHRPSPRVCLWAAVASGGRAGRRSHPRAPALPGRWPDLPRRAEHLVRRAGRADSPPALREARRPAGWPPAPSAWRRREARRPSPSGRGRRRANSPRTRPRSETSTRRSSILVLASRRH